MFGFFERRKVTRYAVDIPIDSNLSETTLPIHTHIREVSAEGLMMVTEKPIEMGVLIKMAFEIPRTAVRPKPTLAKVEGHVIHSKRRDERFFEVGINIESINPEAQEAYALYIGVLAK